MMIGRWGWKFGMAQRRIMNVRMLKPVDCKSLKKENLVIKKQGESKSFFQQEKLDNLSSRSRKLFQASEKLYPIDSFDKEKVQIDQMIIVNSVSQAQVIFRNFVSEISLIYWNIEYMGIDEVRQTFVNFGEILNITAYVPKTGLKYFIDPYEHGNFNPEIIQIFKEYFEDPLKPKVFHNLSVFFHLFARQGIFLKGVYADTRQLARLVDSSFASWEGKVDGRRANSSKIKESLIEDDLGNLDQAEIEEEISSKELSGYNLENLSRKFRLKKAINEQNDEFNSTNLFRLFCAQNSSLGFKQAANFCGNISMQISALYDYTSRILSETEWHTPVVLNSHETSEIIPEKSSMMNFYQRYIQPFSQLLLETEQRGLGVDVEHLKTQLRIATEDFELEISEFRKIVSEMKHPLTGQNLNGDESTWKFLLPRSTKQIRQLIFGTPLDSCDFARRVCNKKTSELIPGSHEIKCAKGQIMKINGIGLEPILFRFGKEKISNTSPSGWPKVSTSVLKEYAGNPPTGSFGKAYEQLTEKFGDDEYARQACWLLHHLHSAVGISAAISGFITPLIERSITRRIHASLSMDTSTGRLVCRRPNLQNPPTGDHDKYKIRKSIIAKPGNLLVVADYSQLELKVLAHVTGCLSMIRNLKSGGDCHSATAAEMFPEVAESIEKRECLLDGNSIGTSDFSDIPNVKMKFPGQRQKAKTLNFSIAYGKSERSLAEEMDCRIEEVKEMLDRWYQGKEEVKTWKKQVISKAKSLGYVESIMGRRRVLPHINHKRRKFSGRSERAAINFCIQGSAADIAMAAMLRIDQHKKLSEIFKFKIVLQVHDEIILEGPEEHAKDALEIVKALMSEPFDGYNFQVPLTVDGGIGRSWLDAKP